MDTYFVLAGAFIIFFLVSIGALIVLWIAVPFSVFGTKELLRKQIEEQEKTNRILAALLETSLMRERGAIDERTARDERENTH